MASNIRVGYITLEVVIAVACCLGNTAVIWAVWTSGALRHPTFCFIASLAVADFLVGAVVVPLAVVLDVGLKTSFYGCLCMCCILIMLQLASVSLLLAIAVDRCLRVCIPLTYKSTVTQKRAWMVVAFCIFTSALLGFIPMFGWNNSIVLGGTKANSSSFECSFMAVIPTSYLVNFIFFGFLFSPLVIMAGLYCYIFLTTRRQLKAHLGVTNRSSTYYQKEQKLAVSLVLVLVFFAVCWLPLFLMHTALFYDPKIKVPTAIIYIGILLSRANSAINPIVYAFKIPKIKEPCHAVWLRIFNASKVQQKGQKNIPNNESNSRTENTDTENADAKLAVQHKNLCCQNPSRN